MQNLAAGLCEQWCYDVIVLSQPYHDLFLKMFKQNNYMNIKKTAINIMLLWWTLDSVRLYQYRSQFRRKFYNEDPSGERKWKCKTMSIKPNWQANWTCKATNGIFFRKTTDLEKTADTFLTFGDHKRRLVLGNDWTHDQLSVLWRNTQYKRGTRPKFPQNPILYLFLMHGLGYKLFFISLKFNAQRFCNELTTDVETLIKRSI